MELLDCAWNQKNLDYEIETFSLQLLYMYPNLSWNQKNLDYEIETVSMRLLSLTVKSAWNQKNLDYEIETNRSGLLAYLKGVNLKSKESRLRDWNSSFYNKTALTN